MYVGNCVVWTIPSQPVIASERTIDRLNEQIIKEYGFSVAIVQTPEVGTTRIDGNGVIGYEEEYATEEPIQWLTGIPDDFSGGTTSFGDLVYDYVDNSPGGEDADIDPNEAFTNIGPGYFYTLLYGELAPKRRSKQRPSIYVACLERPEWR
jgi:hypothetical protein